LSFFEILWYFLLGFIVLAVPATLFVMCGGRELLRKWTRSDGNNKKRRDGYQQVAVDLEK